MMDAVQTAQMSGFVLRRQHWVVVGWAGTYIAPTPWLVIQ